MRRVYDRPAFVIEHFVPNQCIAGCDWSIVSGTDPVKIYCANTSYVTVFTSDNTGCTYKRTAFTTTSDAKDFFSHLFQWGADVAEATASNAVYTADWTADQRQRANNEMSDGFDNYYPDTITIGKGSANTVRQYHAGYALDFLNGSTEGKALS